MNFLQRIARRLLLGNGGKRSYASANFQTAAVNRLTASWTTSSLSADSQARMDLPTARARCRELRDNNDYAAQFISMLKTNILGESGINFRSRVKEPDRVVNNILVTGAKDVFANKIIEDSWWKWGRRQSCTVSGTLSWCDVQKVALESVAVDGEVFIRKMSTAPSPENPFGFSLKLIEADYLDEQANEIAPNGNEIRMGVEIDMNHKPVAYHFLTHSASESFYYRPRGFQPYRVPASEIIHLGIPRRINQTRFMPWMVTAGYRMNMVGKYEEAEVTAARAAASKMGFFESENAAVDYTGEKDESGNTIMEAEPGIFEKLPTGWKFNPVDWQHPATSYEVFMKTALRGIAAGLNVSYNSLANDMQSVNFASGKLGFMAEREVFKAIQAWFIERFCKEVFAAWLEYSLTNNALAGLPFRKLEKFNSPVFRGRRWSYINPSQEVDADIRQLNAGLTSLSRILAERNIDRDELFDEIADDREALESRDISLSEILTESPEEMAAVENGVDASDSEDETEDTDDEDGTARPAEES